MTGSGKITMHSIYGIPVNKPFVMCYCSPGQPTVESKIYMIVEYSGTPFTEPIKVSVKGNVISDEKNVSSDDKYLQELNRIFNCDDILNIKTITNLKSSFESNIENVYKPQLVSLKENNSTVYKCLRTAEKGISYRTSIALQKGVKENGINRLNNFEQDLFRKEKDENRPKDSEQYLDGEDIFLKNLYNMSEIAKKGKAVTLTEDEINSGRQLHVNQEDDIADIQENYNIDSDNSQDSVWNYASREIKIEPMDDYGYSNANSVDLNKFVDYTSESDAKEKCNKQIEARDNLDTVLKEPINAMDKDMDRSSSNKDKPKLIDNCTGNLIGTETSKSKVNKLFKKEHDCISESDSDIITNLKVTPGSNNLANSNRQVKSDLMPEELEEKLSKKFSKRISNQKDNSNFRSDYCFKTEAYIKDGGQDHNDVTDTTCMENTDEENECSMEEDPDYVPSFTKVRKTLTKYDARCKRKVGKNRQSLQTPVAKKVKNYSNTENLIPDQQKQIKAKLENPTQVQKKVKVNSSTECSSMPEKQIVISVKLQDLTPDVEKAKKKPIIERSPVPLESEASTVVLKKLKSSTTENPSPPEEPKRISVKLEDYHDKFYLEDLISLHRMDRGKSDSEKTVQVMVCADCKKFKTEDQTQMEIHIEQHVNGELTCKKCQFIGKSLKEMSMHQSEVHKKHIKNHSCFLCKEKFKFLQNYQEHVAQEHNLLPWVCNHCSSIEKPVMFENRSSYREHFVEKHKDLLLQCVHCGLYFANKKVLRRHSCDVMNQDRKAPCDICGKVLASAMSVKLHKNNVHFNIRAYPCSQCNYTAKSSLVLKNHVQARHRGVRPYKCDECNFSSVKASQLASHKRTHTGQRPYKCDKCPYTAAWNVQLKDHKKLHETALGLECMFCSVVVRKGAAYSKHMKKAHGFDEF